MQWRDEFSERELREIEFSRLYQKEFNHGTDGHNAKIIIAKLAAILDTVAAFDAPLDDTRLLLYLHRLLEKHGTQGELARHLSVSQSALSVALAGRPPTDVLLRALGLRRVVTYVADRDGVDMDEMLRRGDDVVISS